MNSLHKESSMPRILFISTSLPPIADSQTIRNIFLINAFLRDGYSVQLVQPPSKGGDQTLSGMFSSDVTRLFTGLPLYDRLVGSLTSISAPSIRSVLHRVIARSAGLVCVPDVRVGWDKQAYNAAVAAFDDERPDIIISSSGSNTAHLAAGRLVRAWNKPWIAEFGDPWSLNPIAPACHPHIRFLNGTIERRVLRSASGIVFTTEETRVAFAENVLPDGTVPTIVVACGYDPILINDPFETQGIRRGEFVLAYTGTAGRGSRDLSPLLDALQRILTRDPSVPRIRVRLVGSVAAGTGKSRAGWPKLNIDNTGWMPYPESISEIRRADMLVLIGNRSSLQIPAKAFNYLASGKPIIYIPQQDAKSDPTWQLLLGHSPRRMVLRFGKDKELADFLRNAATTGSGRLAPSLNIPSWEEVGLRFAGFVHSILHAGQTDAFQ